MLDPVPGSFRYDKNTDPRTFAEMEITFERGFDFEVEIVDRGARVLVCAPHGGTIEPGTDLIARKIAGADLSYYSLLGLRRQNSLLLHLPSSRFDEPRFGELAGRTEFVCTVHGCRGDTSFACVGGLAAQSREELRHAFAPLPFLAVEQPPEHLLGVNPANVCNRGTRGAGIQLELSRGLRDHLASRAGAADLEHFASAVRGVLGDISRAYERRLPAPSPA